MIDSSLAAVNMVSTHLVGNKNNQQLFVPSQSPVPNPGGKLEEHLLKFFLAPFNLPSYYQFTFSNGDLSLNPVHRFCTEIFERPDSFHFQTVNLAKHLYDLTLHPNIKSGDLLIGLIDNITIDQQPCTAISIIKSEHRQPYLKLDPDYEDFNLDFESGIEIGKPDKGCLIINLEKEEGYRVLVVDKTSKGEDARFWMEEFLNIKPRQDEFQHTREFLTLAKDFVTHELPARVEVSRTDQIDLLNRSVEYFKSNDSFDKQEFEEEVFRDPQVIGAFRDFDTGYREQRGIETPDSFEISDHAVKKQARVFKSVLKLDKNFHIYIHGDRELIERGVDEQGRKYYKIFFKEES